MDYDCEDIIDMTEDELGQIDVSDAKVLLNKLQKEYDELNKEYMSGNPDMYPPDWYDRYVFPLSMAIDKIEDYIEFAFIHDELLGGDE